MEPVTVGYGSPPPGWGLAPFKEAREYASGQVARALYGTPLANLNAEPHPPLMVQGAADPREANYRAAYWLAIGSRILQARGQPSANLTASASSHLAAATISSNPLAALSPIAWLTTSGGAGKTARILNDAAGALEAAGLPEVGAILRRSGSPAAIEQQQKATEGQGWDSQFRQMLAQADPRPAWMKSTGFQIATYGLMGLVGLGVLAWLVRWSLGPYFGAGRAAYRAARRL